MIKVVFFAALRERLDCAETEVEGFQGSVAELIDGLVHKRPDWKQWLQDGDLLCAVNQTLSDPSVRVTAGDEIALFPPVTGG